MTYAPPPPDVRETLMAWTARHRPDCIPHPRPTPNVLYRVVALPDGTVEVSDLRPHQPARRDGDDEPWGDPVGLGMPRPRMTLTRALWHLLTWKIRRLLRWTP